MSKQGWGDKRGPEPPGGVADNTELGSAKFTLTSPLEQGFSLPRRCGGSTGSDSARSDPWLTLTPLGPRTHAASRFTKNHSIKILSIPGPISAFRLPQLPPLSHSGPWCALKLWTNHWPGYSTNCGTAHDCCENGCWINRITIVLLINLCDSQDLSLEIKYSNSVI